MAAFAATGPTDAACPIEEAFHQPCDDAKPWVFWYWMNANASAKGITRDLEAMAEFGIGGALLMPVGPGGERTLAEPPANPLSPHWWDLVGHATREADRLGLRLAMNACEGWALAGGPWITPELSMQELVSTTRTIDSATTTTIVLDRPLARENFYRDIAVLAWPASEHAGLTSTALKPKMSTNIPGLDVQAVADGAAESMGFPSEGWIQFEFEQPFTCRSIRVSPDQRSAYQLHRAEIQVSDDGITFRSLGRLQPSTFHGWQDHGVDSTHSIPATTARFFRFIIDGTGSPPACENHEGAKPRHRVRLTVRHIELSSESRIHQWEGKAGFRWRRSDWKDETHYPDDLCVPLDQVLNLTEKLQPDGTLDWSPPPGRWTIQRIGHTTTGKTNKPASTGVGLECDKFNPAAARIQFDGWFGQALDNVGPDLAGRVLWRTHTDSWEAYSQNWSPVFRDEFIRLRGYDPLLWLPAMSGTPMGTAEQSERFLYDVRRTIADLVCENFYQPFTAAARARGTGFTAESIAPTMMSDGLQHFQYTDMPMGEFWLNSPNQDKPNDILDAISGGRIYGKRIIGAEAFTQNPLHWNEDPFLLKPLGDYQFTLGINRFVLHVWAHQAFEKQPGITLNAVGTFFSGNQTWHRPGRAWVDYLQRCSSLLQQGLPVTDVCYFIGEEIPSRAFLRKNLPLPLPDGYSYDSINRDALLNLATASNDGRLLLADGMSYRVLVLPPSDRMSPELAEKIGSLAQAGVPIIGTHPSRSISLSGYPDCDTQVRDIVANTWQSVHRETTLQQILTKIELPPNVKFPGVDMTPVFHQRTAYHSPPFAWTHRREGETDLYFLSNQQPHTATVEVSFRITGRIPELWNPATGEMMDAPIWRQENNRTLVPIRFDPAGSWFVIFRRAADGDPIANITTKTPETSNSLPPLWIEKNQAWTTAAGAWQITRQSGKPQGLQSDTAPATQTLTTPWAVTFPPDLGAPASAILEDLQCLTHHSDPGIRHFSGTATYTTTFEAPAQPAGHRHFLDLGKVANLAEVTLNGQSLGVLWKPPYLAEITDSLRPGTNTLIIAVTNTWRNRLLGDLTLPEDQRTTWLSHKSHRTLTPDAPLDPSGLLGPVEILSAHGIALENTPSAADPSAD